LENSIFCFAIGRAQLFPKTTEEKERALRSVVSKMNLNKKVLDWVQKKDENGLMLWFDPSLTTWSDISKQLHEINDPVTNNKYNPLILDEQWWLNQYNHQDNTLSKFGVNGQNIVNEIKRPKLKFAPSMELLWHSNPTLIPMTTFEMRRFEKENRSDTSALSPTQKSKSKPVTFEEDKDLAIPQEEDKDLAIPQEEDKDLAIPQQEDKDLAIPQEDDKDLAIPQED